MKNKIAKVIHKWFPYKILNQIDILTVSCNNRELLEKNYKLTYTEHLDIRWHVVRNDPSEEFDKKFSIIEGIHPRNVRKPKLEESVGFASYHHAAALNKGLKYIRPDSKWLLILDPDFFMVPRLENTVDWINKLKLDFFGAEYPPSDKIERIRDFPVAYCLFINLDTIDIKSLNFAPSQTQDTGYRIYQKYKETSKYRVAHYSTDLIFPVSNGVDFFQLGKRPFGAHIHAKMSLAHGYSKGEGKKLRKNDWAVHQLPDQIKKYRRENVDKSTIKTPTRL